MSTNSIFEKKMIVALVAILGTFFLGWHGKMDVANIENVLVWVAGVFILGEASADWAKWFMTGQATSSQSQINNK